jgi:hypothetical protein
MPTTRQTTIRLARQVDPGRIRCSAAPSLAGVLASAGLLLGRYRAGRPARIGEPAMRPGLPHAIAKFAARGPRRRRIEEARA